MGKGDPGRHKPLGQVLKEMELVSEGQIQEALQIQRKQGGVIGEILVGMGYVAREEILLALAAQMGMEVVGSRRARDRPRRHQQSPGQHGQVLQRHSHQVRERHPHRRDVRIRTT
jgi:hypothetical protein